MRKPGDGLNSPIGSGSHAQLGYNRDMVFEGKNSDNGLVTVHVSATIDGQCLQAHTEFLKAHNINMWMLTVLGLQAPAVSATSNPPDGHEGTTKDIALTLDFQTDLRQFLESQYAEYVARQSR